MSLYLEEVMILKKYKKNRQRKLVDCRKLTIGLAFAKYLVFLAVFTLAGCDFCADSSGGSNGENEIFFTAISINGTIPNVYSVYENGGRIRERLKNSRIFSAPARNGRVAALRYDTLLRKDIILIARIAEGDLLEIERKYEDFNPAYPVLSPDGAKISFYGGSNYLYLYKIDEYYTERVSNSYAENTLPAFSQNGKLMAFFEGSHETGNMKLVVIDTDNLNYPDRIVYEREFPEGIESWRGETSIDFQGDGSHKPYYLTVSDGKRIYYISLINKTEEVFDISAIGAFMPAKQPSAEYFAFTAKNGNVYLLNPEGFRFNIMTDGDSTEINLYAQWSSDGKRILCNKYYEYGARAVSTLFILDVATKRAVVVSNNAHRGFWKQTWK